MDYLRQHPLLILDLALPFLGFALRRRGILKPQRIQDLTWILVTIVYPLLIFATLPVHFSRDSLSKSWMLPFFVIIYLGLGALVGLFMGFKLKAHLTPDKKRSFVFMTALPNYAFLPLLIGEHFWSKEATAHLIFASFGGDLFLWLCLIPFLGGHKGERLKIFLKPPVLALMISLALVLGDNKFLLENVQIHSGSLHFLGALSLPLSMFILGAHLGAIPIKLSSFIEHLPLVFLRLVAIPLIVLITSPLFASEEEQKATLLISMMPTAISSVIFTELFRGSAEYCAQQVLLCHVAALISLPIWFYYTHLVSF